MKLVKRVYVMLVLVALLVIGCSQTPLHNTRVLDKQYEPANTTVIIMPMVIGKVTVLIPYTIYDDEDFVLNVMGYTEDGDRLCRRIYVTSSRFDKVAIGDKVDDLTMQYEDEHRKEKK